MTDPARLPTPTQTVAFAQLGVDANGEPVLPGRAFYKWLASALILDRSLWLQFFDRCKAMAAAQLYGHKRAETVAAAVLKGYSLGMDFMEALSKIKVIKGNPVLRGPNAIAHVHAVVPGARCRPITGLLRAGSPHGEITGFAGVDRADLVARLQSEHPDCWIEDRLDPTKIAVWLMVRPDWEPSLYTFTMGQAELAGLPARNENWRLYPDRCLKWQAASVGTQEMFGDELEGMYLAEELENAPTVRAIPAPAQAAPPAAEDEPSEYVDTSAQPVPDGDEPYTNALKSVGERLRRFRVSYAKACQRALGRELGANKPTPDELDALGAFCDQLDAWHRSFAEGTEQESTRLRVYATSYDRHRPVVERYVAGPNGSSWGAVWTGAAHSSEDDVRAIGGCAALLVFLGEPVFDAGPDEEPSPEAIEAANKAVEEARAENKRRQESSGPIVAGSDANAMMHAAAKGSARGVISQLVGDLETQEDTA
jgi:hypothetical protein